ncbi:hypothetical protein SISSUDRAFT_1055123 [Sistotremastrum suecicum HHB10207 ss-3]|uniref:F-box domain-containing protein n=1 Tax=Sistotremastrum suecicum HHB10207 ss-3 TaxID=1314776 RepID=A0A165Y137_9AGAM|nr:hypothetical protein SISSUDRAFT_1055123 [Sistotremastrum suecicum HHB10207 ss-3]
MDVATDWSKAKTLLNLSRTSKAWRAEALRRLFSALGLQLRLHDIDLSLVSGIDKTYPDRSRKADRIIRKVAVILSQDYTRYLSHLMVSVGDLDSNIPRIYRASSVKYIISEILTRANALQSYEFTCSPHAGSTNDVLLGHDFSQLKILTVHIQRGSQSNRPYRSGTIDLRPFLRRHPSLTHLGVHDFDAWDPSSYSRQRHQRTLPNLRYFAGDLLTARLLNIAKQDSLLTVALSWEVPESGDPSLFSWDKIRGSFSNVHTLNIHTKSPILDRQLLLDIARCFPNLVVLDGLRLSGSMIVSLVGELNTLHSVLPQLRDLVMSSSKNPLIQDPSHVDDLKKAMRHLPEIFPALEVCSQYSGCGIESCKVTLSYAEDGTASKFKVSYLGMKPVPQNLVPKTRLAMLHDFARESLGLLTGS